MIDKQKIKQNFQIILELAKTDFKLRYNGSILGYVWSLLKPLLIFTILNFVFVNIFGQTDPNYSLKLLTSLIVWNFFSEGTMTGMTSLMAKAGILTKIKISKANIVIASTIHILITYLINLIIIAIFFITKHFVPEFTDVLLFFFYSATVYVLILGFSFFTAPLYIRYRDLNQIWEVLLLAGFYASPIIYPMSAIPSYLHWALHINPMTFVIQYIQATLFNQEFTATTISTLIYYSLLTIVFYLSTIFFNRSTKRLVEQI